MRFLKRWWAGRRQSGSNSRQQAGGNSGGMMETLEGRLHLSTAPQITGIFADNRGKAVMYLNAPLNKATVTTSTVIMRTAGPDGVINTADDVRRTAVVKAKGGGRRIVIKGNLPVNTPYRVIVKSDRVLGTNGVALDGEFKGANQTSGNGVPGGKYKCVVRSIPTKMARFTTSYGNIDVLLYKDQTPQTVANFMKYANSGAWDGTIIHRSIPSFVIQGGGFRVNSANNGFSKIPQLDPVVNEPGLPNIRGTIAMAKLPGDPDSATNQWFLNLKDNRGTNPNGLDYQNGGFTVFGTVTDAGGLAVMDAIAGRPTIGSSAQPLNVPVDGQTTPFTDVPVNNTDTIRARGYIDPQADMVVIHRVAIAMGVQAS